MMGRIIFYLAMSTFCLDITTQSPLDISIQNTTDSQLLPEVRSDKSKNKISDHKGIEELVKQQTETVKKIVADQKQQTRLEYPVVTKLESQHTEQIKKEAEKLSLEELKIKCQHLSKLLAGNKTNDGNVDQNVIPISSTRRVNNKPQDSQKRPVYVQPKTTVKPTTTKKTTGFYITTQSSTTKKPVEKTQPPIKYIRLEPVILQKTILNDGRIVYYWHRSLPTAVEFSNDATQNKYVPTDSYTPYNNYVPPVHNNYGNAPPYGYPVLPPNTYIPAIPNSYIPSYQNTYSSTTSSTGDDKKPIDTTTQTSTTSTTEQSSYSGYGFGSFLPFYSLTKQESTTTTTTEPPTTTTTSTTTTPKPSTEKPKTDDLLYAQQLRFVIPVPYENSGNIRQPWDFDQYAYYPKELQPKTVNVQVPYSPTFHMVTAIAVPNSEGNLNEKILHQPI